jgi:hypothetical protein
MPNAYVEPRSKGRPEGTPITGYVLEFVGGQHLCASVRHTDKGKPDHSRPRG